MLSDIWVPGLRVVSPPETPTLHLPTIQQLKGYPQAKNKALRTLLLYYLCIYLIADA